MIGKVLEDFKAGCELLAAGAQWAWQSLNTVQQFLAFTAGMCLLAAFLGWLRAKVMIWRRGGVRFCDWYAALKHSTEQLFSVEEAYAMYKRRLHMHADLKLLASASEPVAEMSEEEQA